MIAERWFLQPLFDKLPSLFAHIYLIVAVIVSWVLFYYTDFGRMTDYLSIMLGMTEAPLHTDATTKLISTNAYWLLFCVLASLPMRPLMKAFIVRSSSGIHIDGIYQIFRIVLSLLFLTISSILLVGDTYNPFIYFRF